MRKKIIALMVCLVLALSVCTSCGGNKKESETEKTQESGWFKDAFKVHDNLGY